MRRDLLAHFPVVAAVARCRGFAAAAALLGMSPSAVSHAVRAVEDAIGQPLFIRTTRSVALTQAGAGFMAAIGPALSAIDEAIDRIGAAQGRVTGLLRLNVPRIALPIAITPVLAEMAARHPALTVEVTCDDGLVDIVAAGFDAGVRLGEMIDDDMVAIRLTPPFQAIMVASPAYLDTHGVPRAVADLHDHNCIGFRLVASGAAYAWELTEAGRDLTVQVRGTVRVTDPASAKELALAGIGVAYLFQPLIRRELEERTLRWVIPDATMREPGLFLYFPRHAARQPKLRAFIDVARGLAQSEAGVPQTIG